MLQNLMRIMKKDDKGFTLVELMIVVVIIGILIAIAIPVYRSIEANAREKACQANQRSIKSQLEVYKADETGGNGSYPASTGWDTTLNPYFEGTGFPECPSGGSYTYTLAGDGLSYTLACSETGHSL